MTAPSDWIAWEDRIAELLPKEGSSPHRARLLRELSSYGRAVVREAEQLGVERVCAADREQTMAWLGRPVFICGHHRTGTTLLSELLDGHPELVVLPSEGTYFTSFGYVARSSPTRQDVERFLVEWIARLVDPNYEPHFKIGRSGPAGNPSVLFARRFFGWHAEMIRASRERASFAVLLSLVAAFDDMSPAPRRRRMWVEKTPLNERHVDRLALFSEARFIQLVRDPAATLASLVQAQRASGMEVDAAGDARRIGLSLGLARRNMRRLPKRYLVVRYEDLVGNPALQMEQVRSFLGISRDASLATPTVLGLPVRANSSFDAGEPGVIRPLRPPPTLRPREAMLIGAFAASAARALGYEVAAPALRPRTALWVRESVRMASRSVGSRLGRAFTRRDPRQS
jgi:Sulfotransferase family